MRKILLRASLLGGCLLAQTAHAAILWDGDASKGTAVFGEVQSFNGPITVVDDPTYGKVFKIVCNDNGATKARSEVSYMAGVTLDPKNGDYYIAWRSKWGPLPTKADKWQVLAQIHHDPVGLGGPVPFGLSVPGDGKMHFNAQDPTGRSYSMWDHALPIDSWHRYVVHTKMGETLTTGFCEIWFDGVKQTLTNGQEKIGCAMSRPNAGSHWKWGVYRSGAGGPIGQSVHYLQHPVLGTSYEDVAEEAPVGGGAGGNDAGPSGGDAPADTNDGGRAGGGTGGVDAADDQGASAAGGSSAGEGGGAASGGSSDRGASGGAGRGGSGGASAGASGASNGPRAGGPPSSGCGMAAPGSSDSHALLPGLLGVAMMLLSRARDKQRRHAGRARD